MFRIFIIFLLLIEPLQSNFNFEKENQKIINQFLKDIKYLKIHADGVGGGISDEINLVSLSLTCKQNFRLDLAKTLHIVLIKSLLTRYNSNCVIRPYLHNFPFTYKNLNFMLAFEDGKGNFVQSEYIALITIARNKVFYQIYDHEKKLFKTVAEIPIEEVL